MYLVSLRGTQQAYNQRGYIQVDFLPVERQRLLTTSGPNATIYNMRLSEQPTKNVLAGINRIDTGIGNVK